MVAPEFSPIKTLLYKIAYIYIASKLNTYILDTSELHTHTHQVYMISHYITLVQLLHVPSPSKLPLNLIIVKTTHTVATFQFTSQMM